MSGESEQKTKTESQTSTSSELIQAPQFRKLLSGAESLYEQRFGADPSEYLPSSLLAEQSGETLGAYEEALGGLASTRTSTEGIQEALAKGLGVLDSPEQNQVLQDAIDAAISPLTRAFERRTLSGIEDQAQGAGQQLGTRRGIAEGLAGSDLQEQQAEIAKGLTLQSLGTRGDIFGRTLAAAPQTIEFSLFPSQVRASIGRQMDQRAQQELEAANTLQQLGVNFDTEQLRNFQSFLAGNYGGTGTGQATGSTVTTTPGASPLEIAMGLGAAGAGMAGSAASGGFFNAGNAGASWIS